MRFARLALSFIFTLMTATFASAANSGVTYQGRILKPDGSPLAGANVQFKLQIRTPDSSDCLLYEESKASVDMRNSNGAFSITMNDGTGARTSLLIGDGAAAPAPISIERVFANRGSYTFDPTTCNSGSTYTPSASDGRNLVVLFKDETMASWEPIPAQKINFVPFAFESKQIGGFSSSALMRVVEADGSPSVAGATPLSNAEYARVLALAQSSLTSGQYIQWNGSAFVSGDPVAGVQTFAKNALPTCTAGQFLQVSAGGFACATPTGTGGTVTQVNTGTGLTGGGFTTSGTISIAAGGVGTAEIAAGAVTSAKLAAGAVDSAALAADAVTTAKIAADAVTSAKIADGTISSADLANNISINTSGTVSSRGFSLFPTGAGTNGITFAAPAGLSSSYTLTWPLAQSSGAQALVNDGSGNLSWTSLSAASQWTTQAPGINYMGGNVGIGTTSPVSKLQVAGAVAVADGSLAAPSMTFSGRTDTGFIRDVSNSATAISLVHGGAKTFTSDQNGFYAVSTRGPWLSPAAGTAANPAYTFVGDLNSGLYQPVSSTIALATNSTERLRIDSTGNVGIGTTSPNGQLDVKGSIVMSGATSGYTGFQPASAAGSTVYTLPAGDGLNGQVLSTNGAGILAWTSPGGGGTVTNVSSANADIGVATGASTPVLTLNSGTGANQIVKLDGSAKLPAIDGSALTNLNAGNIGSGTLPVSRGGTGATSFANYSVIASNASGNQVSVPGSTSNTMLQWSVTGPTWSSASWPSTTTANQLLYSSANNVVGGLPTANNSLLTTDGSGLPSFTSTLPSAVQSNITSVGTLTLGTWNGTAIAPAYGGTGQTSYTTGDLLYASSSSALSKLPASTSGYVLTSNGAGAAPSWQAAGSGSQWTTQAPGINYMSGTVGIGTTSPTAKLEVSATGSGAVQSFAARGNPGGTGNSNFNSVVFDNTYGAGNFKNQFSLRASGVEKWSIGNDVNGNGGQNFYIYDAGTNSSPFFIDNARHVGIGFTTTNPTVANTLDVKGNAAFGSYAGTAAPSDGLVVSGSVGVGTNAPVAPLDVVSTGTKSSGIDYGAKITQTVNQSGAASYTGLLVNVTESATGSGNRRLLDLQSGGTTKFYVDRNGNASMGAADFSSYISAQVFGAQAYSPTSSSSSNPAGLSGYFTNNDASWGSAFSGITTTARNTSGTNQSGHFGVVSTASGNAPSIVMIQQTGATAYAERMRIDPNGNVGIGTTAPRAALDVNGAVLMRDPASVSTSSVDFATGNIRYTTNDCGAFSLFSMKSGGSYSFVVQGTNSTTCTFTAYSSADTSAPLTVHMPGDHAATVAGKHTMYTILVVGTHAYLTWAPGL